MVIEFKSSGKMAAAAEFTQVFVFLADGEGAAPSNPGGGVILPHSRSRRIAAMLNGE